MTITTTTNRAAYSGNGSTTAFDFSYYVEDAADLRVVLRASDGTETVQTISTHYTVSGVGSAAVTVTMVTAPASGERLVIVRQEPVTQETNASALGTYRATAFEDQLDRFARQGQRLLDQSDRSMKIKETDLDDSNSVWDAESRKIVNVAAPSADDDAATKEYVDDIAAAYGMTAAKIAEISANTAARHTHANSAILDAVEEAFTSALKTNYDDAYGWGDHGAAGYLPNVASISELRSLTASDGEAVIVSGRGVAGAFKWNSGDVSASILGSGVTSTAVDSGTGEITSADHGLYQNNAVIVTSGVNGLTTNTLYYVIEQEVSALYYDGETSNFTEGQTLTGASSGHTATIDKVIDNGTSGTLWLSSATGTFTNNEAITDGAGGAAVANGVVFTTRDTDGFKLASSFANAVSGTSVTLTGTSAMTVKRHHDPKNVIRATPLADITGASGAWERAANYAYSQPNTVSPQQAGYQPDGSTDGSEEFQAAIDVLDGLGGGVLYLPAEESAYKLANIYVRSPIRITGDGIGTRLSCSDDGYMFVLDDYSSADTAPLNIKLNRENSLSGVIVENFYAMNGAETLSTPIALGGTTTISRSSLQDAGFMQVSNQDQLRINNIRAAHFRREAINFKTKVRESTIDKFYAWYCGDSDNAYSVINVNEVDATADAHNNIYFNDLFLIYSLGIEINLDCISYNSSSVRNIYFNGVMLHGVIPQIDGDIYTLTSAMKNHTQVSNTRATNIYWVHSRFHSAGYNSPCVTITDDPNGVIVSQSFFTQCAFNPGNGLGTATSHNYPGISLDTAKISLSSCQFSKRDRTIQDTANSLVFYDDASNIEDGEFPSTGPEYLGTWSGVGAYRTGTSTVYLADNNLSNGEGQTASAALCYWTRTGDRVSCDITLNMTSLGTLTGGQTARICGLPFTSNAINGQASVQVGFTANLSLSAPATVTGYVNNNSSYIILQKVGDTTTGTSALLVSEVTGSGQFKLSVTYRT